MLAEVRVREAPAEESKDGARGDATSNASSLPYPKDKIEEQNLLHAAMMASEDDRSGDAREALEKVLALDPKSPTAQPAASYSLPPTFVSDENTITVPLTSTASDVTVVQVYPTLETERRWHRELVLQSTQRKSNGG